MAENHSIYTIEDIQKAVRGGIDLSGLGDVSVRYNDTGSLMIVKYTSRAAFKNNWTPLELLSRGLILSSATGEIVARPYDKFFNWGQGGRTTNAPLITYTDKEDGSLGILYRDPDEDTSGSQRFKIATAGSFSSEQALWATEYIQSNCAEELEKIPDRYTLMFEIIYPDNRIVLDYQGEEKLILTGVRNMHTGEYQGFQAGRYSVQAVASMLPGIEPVKSHTINSMSVDRLIEMQAEWDGVEGWVAYFADGSIFKFKTEDYVCLHRVANSMNKDAVKKAIAAGDISRFIADAPDEFHNELKEWRSEIESELRSEYDRMWGMFERAISQVDNMSTRKEQANFLMQEYKSISRYVFKYLDGEDTDAIASQMKHDILDNM